MQTIRFFSIQPKIDSYFTKLESLESQRNEEENEDAYIA